MDLTTLDRTALEGVERKLERSYQALKVRNYQIDMTRGKLSPDQLDLSDGMLSILGPGDCFGTDGADYRNYGFGTGIPEAKAFFAAFLEVELDEIIVGGNSSLNMMFDAMAGAVLFGIPGGDGPWHRQSGIKFLCPAPGYDRHFAICERLDIEMVSIDLRDDGPDMDLVEELAANDAGIKGIWCVPKYSNPTGICYSDDVTDRLANIRAAAPDFRIFWDNAYSVHHLGSRRPQVRNILQACKDAGNPERALMFASTSKMTYPGAGVAVMAASAANIADATRKMSIATIGPDKINQMRHVRFFRDIAGIQAHMEKHAALIAPKFETVDAALERHLSGKGIATWSKPDGGYFVSVDVLDGCAAETVRLAGDVGVKFVPAGATFPYGRDPRDRNLRLAPTMPSQEEVANAMEVFCVCAELACIRKLKEHSQ